MATLATLAIGFSLVFYLWRLYLLFKENKYQKSEKPESWEESKQFCRMQEKQSEALYKHWV